MNSSQVREPAFFRRPRQSPYIALQGETRSRQKSRTSLCMAF
ncbi:unnamed protein product [Ixodes pacificus]